MHAPSLLLSLSFVLAPSVPLAAQSGGPVVGLPHGFSIDLATLLPGIGPGELVFSNAGIDGTQPPPPMPTGSAPDFSTFLGGAIVDIDGFSLGLDWIVSTPTGEAVVPPGQWAALTFSVSPMTTGVPGSLIASESTAIDGVAADIIAYVIPGSSLPPALVGVPIRAQDGVELNPALASTPGNIDAHDLYVSLLYLENPRFAALLPPPTIFFTVTAASVAAMPAAWTSVPSERSGATVFRTTWVPASLSWTPIAVAYTAADFGIDPSEDIDAIAIDLVRGYALFSVDPMLPPPVGGTRDPLLFSTLSAIPPVPYRLPSGTPLSTALGLSLTPDDIDAICSLDPGSAAQPSPINLDFLLGTPQQALPLGVPTQLQTAAYRTFDPIGQRQFATTWMTGWPPPGNPQVSLAISAAALGSPFGPYVVLDVFVRPQPSNQYQGHPEVTMLQIPQSISMTGQPLIFLWGALSQNTFDTSLPVLLRL